MTLRVDGDVTAGGFSLRARIAAHPGEVTAVTGPSASGKSLLLRWIAGLATGREGVVALGDVTWESHGRALVPTERRGLGYAPQEGALWPHRTVRAQLARVCGDASAARWIAALDLTALAERTPEGLSGGERQRVALARAMGRDARVVLLDEPWSALHRDARHALGALVRDETRARGIVTLLVTHDTDDVSRVAARTLHFDAPGSVVGA